MKKFLFIVLLFAYGVSHSQPCNGTQSFTLTPPPPALGYTPGTVVTVCYTMDGWNGTLVGSNWLEGFDINLGPGWTYRNSLRMYIMCISFAFIIFKMEHRF